MLKGLHQSLKINDTDGGELKERRTKDNTPPGTEIDGEIAPRSTETIHSNEENVDGYSAEPVLQGRASLLPRPPSYVNILENGNFTLTDPSGVDILVLDHFVDGEHGIKVSFVASKSAHNPTVEVYGVEEGGLVDTLYDISKSDSPPEVINISVGNSPATQLEYAYPNLKKSFEEENGLKIGAKLNNWPPELKEKFKVQVDEFIYSESIKFYEYLDEYQAAFQAVVDRGCTVVIAAGNERQVQKILDDLGLSPTRLFFEGWAQDLPPGCIVVGASESNLPDSAPAVFTTPSGEVDVAADGTNVRVNNSLWLPLALRDGTSSSAPQIAGLVADMKALDPCLTPAEIEQILTESATLQPGKEFLLGAGVVDREKALGIVKFRDYSPCGEDLLPNQTLQPNQFLESSNGKYQLLMQGDGNLVLYENYSVAVWDTGTTNAGACKFVSQGDGNAVLYDTDNQPVWHSGTFNSGECRLLVQNDGNIVLYNNDTGTAVWDSGVPGDRPWWYTPPEDNGGS